MKVFLGIVLALSYAAGSVNCSSIRDNNEGLKKLVMEQTPSATENAVAPVEHNHLGHYHRNGRCFDFLFDDVGPGYVPIHPGNPFDFDPRKNNVPPMAYQVAYQEGDKIVLSPLAYMGDEDGQGKPFV